MAGYDHHVFISYRRIAPWEDWVRTLFAPALRGLLALELPGAISVYVDDQINAGAAWDRALHLAVCNSRIMVPVLMNAYFDGEGCRKELARMLQREQRTGFRTPGRPDGLILPIRLSSRHYFPDCACAIQDEDFTDFAIPNLARGTPTHERFDEKMKIFSAKVVSAIRYAPPHDPDWASVDGAAFVDLLVPKQLDIFEPPRLTAT